MTRTQFRGIESLDQFTGCGTRALLDAPARQAQIRCNRRIMLRMASAHISAEEAARNLSALMRRVHAGEEIIIDNGVLTVAVVPTPIPSRRSVSECIARARNENESGDVPVLDPDFAADIEIIIRNRKPWTPPAWE